MPEDGVRRGPRCRVQVAVHQEFSKGEKPEGDRVRVHAPTALATHGALHILEVGANIEVVGVWQFGKLPDTETLLELLAEGNVLAQLVARVFEVKPVTGIRPPQFHRDQDQRGAAKLLAAVFLSPGKHPQCQIEGIYTLLLHGSSRRMIRGQEPGVNTLYLALGMLSWREE